MLNDNTYYFAFTPWAHTWVGVCTTQGCGREKRVDVRPDPDTMLWCGRCNAWCVFRWEIRGPKVHP